MSLNETFGFDLPDTGKIFFVNGLRFRLRQFLFIPNLERMGTLLILLLDILFDLLLGDRTDRRTEIATPPQMGTGSV